MKSYKKFNNIILVLIFLTILSSTIAYSALNQNLSISGNLTYRAKADIRITNAFLSDSNKTIEDYSSKFTKDSLKAGFTFDDNTSYITYEIEVTNFSDFEMGILKINNIPDDLIYELREYQLKDKICAPDGNCKTGTVKNFYITFKPKEQIEPSKNYNIDIQFAFKQFYKVSYEGFYIETSSYPKEILGGETLELTLPEEIEREYLAVLVGGLKVDFQTDGDAIKVSDIKGDVIVKYGALANKIMQLANNKTCHNDNDSHDYSITSTDFYCDGAEGYYDKPPYHTYLSGTNACLDFNYVWYSGYMWRITEILNNGSVKMITENVLSAINFGQDGFFDNSYIKQWLNEDFLDTLYNHDKILVEDASWDISPRYDWCYIKPPKTTKAPVGLMNPYEFNKTAGYGSYNFLNLGHSWWLSSYANPWSDISTTVSGIHYDGSITAWEVPNNAFGVRPMVVLRADVKFKGAGTQNDPFVLLDDIQAAKEGEQINTRTPGELVEINNMLYRIVNTHNEDGKIVTKLKSANYVTDSDGKVIIKKFGDMSMHSYKEVVNSQNEAYWGAYLNGSWLTDDLKKYLVEDTYYVDNAQKEVTDSTIGSYKNTICKEKNTPVTTKDCEKTDKIWKGYVGLPIVGELFAYPLGRTDTHDYKTATMTPYGDGSWPMIGTFETETQGIFQETYDNDFAVKPTITLKEDVIIKSGDGKTPRTAFKIDLPS